MQIIAMIATKVDLSKIPKNQVGIIAIPHTKKYPSSDTIKTDGDFMNLIDEWDGELETVEQEEGDFGISRKGDIHVLTPDGWHLLEEFGDVNICAKCGSDNVFSLEWINMNTGRVDKEVSYEDNATWCKYCNSLTSNIISLTHIRNQQGGQDGNNTSKVPKDNT